MSADASSIIFRERILAEQIMAEVIKSSNEIYQSMFNSSILLRTLSSIPIHTSSDANAWQTNAEGETSGKLSKKVNDAHRIADDITRFIQSWNMAKKWFFAIKLKGDYKFDVSHIYHFDVVFSLTDSTATDLTVADMFETCTVHFRVEAPGNAAPTHTITYQFEGMSSIYRAEEEMIHFQEPILQTIINLKCDVSKTYRNATAKWTRVIDMLMSKLERQPKLLDLYVPV